MQALLRTLKAQEGGTGVSRFTRDANGRVVSIWLSSDAATDENVRLLTRFPGLVRVRIRCPRTPISPDALAGLQDLKQLEELELQYAAPEFPAEVGLALGRMSRLRSLSIEFTAVNADVLIPLKALPQLARLRIGGLGSSFKDADVAELTFLRQIEDLDLSFTGVTDACLDTLALLPRLKTLSIWNTKVTPAGVRRSRLAGRVEVKGASRNAPQDNLRVD